MPSPSRVRALARGATMLAAGGLALAAFRLAPRAPGAVAPAPLRDSSSSVTTTPSASPAPAAERVETLRRGESLRALLTRQGLADSTALRVLGAAGDLEYRGLRAGMPVAFRTRAGDSVPQEIVVYLNDERALHVRRDSTRWTAEELPIAWRTDTIVVSGEIRSSLYDALEQSTGSGVPRTRRLELAWRLADIFEYRIDMSRDLQQGDTFRALVTRAVSPSGDVRLGSILAARITQSGTPIEAIRYQGTAAHAGYFDQHGRSLRLAFLRAPLAFRRISSVFGMRKHPILGIWRNHTGTDYAAAAGTPVRAIGDGVVVFAGRRGGYGNCIDVRHSNGYVTRYGHMRAFARGVRTGAHVAIGQTIGYVGMTGLATAPHLHFEVLVNGVQHDPRHAFARHAGVPIAVDQRSDFEAQRSALVALLDASPAGALRTGP